MLQSNTWRTATVAGRWIILGSILGFLTAVGIFIWMFSQGRCRPNTLKKDNVKFALPIDSSPLKFSIKEVYFAINNLHMKTSLAKE